MQKPTVQPQYKIVACDFDDTLYDTGNDRLFNAAKLKQVLQALHEAGVYLCVVSARGGRARMLKALDAGLGADRAYLKHDDIWTPEKIEELGDKASDFVAGSGKEVVLSYVVHDYNKKNPFNAEKSEVLFTDDSEDHLSRVETAGYKVLRFKVVDNGRGGSHPAAEFLDNLYLTVLGKPLVPSLGASRDTLLAPAGAAGEAAPLLGRAPEPAKNDDGFCNKCVLI